MGRSLDDLLKRVADGDLSPEEALLLLDGDPPPPPAATPAAGPPPPAATPAPPDGGPAPAAPQGRADTLHEPGSGTGRSDEPRPGWGSASAGAAGSGEAFGGRTRTASTTRAEAGEATQVRAVRVLTAYRQVTVVADPTVAQVHVSGRHTVRQEGDLLVVDGCWSPFSGRIDLEEPGLRFAFAALPRGLATAGSDLTVRINPDVALEVDATGASLRISGPEAGARLRLLASSLKVDRLRGPLDLDARTSSVKGSLGPSGQSRIAAEQSSVKVALLPGTELRITANNRMGKVILPGQVSKDGGFGETLHSQVGAARGSLLIEATMSSVLISAEGFGGSR